MQLHEELAALFSRNLTLDPSQPQHVQQIQEPQQQQVEEAQPAPRPVEEPKIVYSISQHYHHSAHIARQNQGHQQQQQQGQQQPQPQVVERPASEPPQSEHQATEAILSRHGIDTSALSRSQLQLFKEADDTQKGRLLELWSIFPPTSSRDNPALAWSNTSMEQEEQLARMRYEHKMLVEGTNNNSNTEMSLDGTPVPTDYESQQQRVDGRWILQQQQHYMEPYMASGYEELARREYEASAAAAALASEPRTKNVYSAFGDSGYTPATDPVYRMVGAPIDDWTLKQQAMENQYGSFTHCRMEF